MVATSEHWRLEELFLWHLSSFTIFIKIWEQSTWNNWHNVWIKKHGKEMNSWIIEENVDVMGCGIWIWVTSNPSFTLSPYQQYYITYIHKGYEGTKKREYVKRRVSISIVQHRQQQNGVVRKRKSGYSNPFAYLKIFGNGISF